MSSVPTSDDREPSPARELEAAWARFHAALAEQTRRQCRIVIDLEGTSNDGVLTRHIRASVEIDEAMDRAHDDDAEAGS